MAARLVRSQAVIEAFRLTPDGTSVVYVRRIVERDRNVGAQVRAFQVRAAQVRAVQVHTFHVGIAGQLRAAQVVRRGASDIDARGYERLRTTGAR